MLLGNIHHWIYVWWNANSRLNISLVNNMFLQYELLAVMIHDAIL